MRQIGYIILANGKVLNHFKAWTNTTSGWVWTEEERNEILSESKAWKIKPTHVQQAEPTNDYTDVIRYGEPKPV